MVSTQYSTITRANRHKECLSPAVLSLLLLTLVGTTCSPVTFKNAEISAMELATVNTLSEDDNYDKVYCGDLVPHGAFEGLEHGAVSVGYYRNHDPGTEPFPCWWWVASVDRGLVRYDLASLAATASQIVGATLEYDLDTNWDHPSVANNCPNDILASLWIVNEPWSDKFSIDAEFLTDSQPSPGCVTSHHSWDVSQVVRDWLSGARPNYGFLFVGGNEGLPSDSSGEHKTTLSNLKLKVLVAVPAAL